MAEKITKKVEIFFRDNNVRLQKLQQESVYTIKEKLNENGIKTHNIISIIKNKSSLIQKMEDKGYKDPKNDIEDIVGIRIVCLFLGQIDEIRRILMNIFELIKEDDKIKSGEANYFGYMSWHGIFRFPGNFQGPRYDDIKDLKFEVQVRTISMDAWASISHHLDYKSVEGVPKELKRDFIALSGLFYVADTHFQMFFDEKQQYKNLIRRTLSTEGYTESSPLNVDTLSEYLKQKFLHRHEDQELWWEEVASLEETVRRAGYSDLAQLDRSIDRCWPAFLRYESNHPPDREEGRKFTDIGAVRVCMQILHSKRVAPGDPAGKYYRYVDSAE